MKKTYQKPVTETVEVEMENMIAASITIGENYDGVQDIEAKPRGVFDDNDTAWGF